jgi:hypothetical protein
VDKGITKAVFLLPERLAASGSYETIQDVFTERRLEREARGFKERSG